MQKLNRLHNDNVLLQSSMPKQIEALRSSVLGALQSLQSEFERQSRAGIQMPRNGRPLQPLAIEPVVKALSQNAETANDIVAASSILKSLRFSAMEFRYSKIPEAHTKTFSWMLSQNFAQWLRSDHPIFWLSGKPGSGKSTCIKFLADNNETTMCLQRWAGSRNLVTASYFFWVNGTAMQKSQEGLFRSLLYDILRRNPNLIPRTFPSLWADAHDKPAHDTTTKHEWERKELLDGLALLFSGQDLSTCFYISLDGLDEYDGDHEELVAVIKTFAQARNVKLCIASRPWNVFEAAFGANQLQKIYLEHFNRPDIELYVKDLLESRDDFKAMKRKEPDAQKLPEEVVSNSQGVFLWVFLVVRSLIRGLQNRDRLQDLLRRLRSFPSDLNEFFNHMLMSLEDIYRVQVARNFQVALSSPRPLSLLNYWYIDSEEGDPDYHDYLPAAGLNTDTVTEIQEDMRIRINGRSKGLLEVTPSAHSNPPFNLVVDFLHRTVKDFLMTKDAQEILKNWTASPGAAKYPEAGEFNVFQSICLSTVAELKTAPVWACPRILCEVEYISELVSVVFISARRYEQATGKALYDLLEDMEKTIPKRYKSAGWTDIAPSLKEHAAQWGLRIYVAQKMANLENKPLRRALILIAACRCRYNDEGNMTSAPDPQMVELVTTTGTRITLQQGQMSKLSGFWKTSTDKRQKIVTAESVYSSLLLIFENCNFNCDITNLGDSFWENVAAIVEKDDLDALRRAPHRSTAASRILSTVVRWAGFG